MSDKWETVGPIKKPRKPKPPVPIPGGPAGVVGQPLQQSNGKAPKPKKHSRKTPASFPLAENDEPETQPVPSGSGEGDRKAKKPQNPPKKHKPSAGGDGKSKEKRRDLEKTLAHIPVSELQNFFEELRHAGAKDMIYSYIKYSADALNTKILQAQPFAPDVSQWPNDLLYPVLTKELEGALRTIISETAKMKEDVDILGISFSSLLASIPTVIQRGDPGWGYLIFLRELCRVDPSLPSRRIKSFNELMESYGNKKEIGLCVLWAVAQAGVDSPYGLKIASNLLMPYYGFKNYKQFVLAALSTISSCDNMAVEYLIEGDEFEEFFEAAFDPKKKRDLEKIYPRVKELVMKGLKGQGSELFLTFLEKVGNKEFLPLSPYGQEVFRILVGCVDNDPSCIDTWRNNLGKYPKESAAVLGYISKVPESLKSGKQLEKKLIQSDEFAVAAVKNPELLRGAKKVQAGMERVALSKRKIFSWKLAIFVILLSIGGLLYLDVTENGKGSFEKSNTGQLLKSYGILKEAVMVWEWIGGVMKYVQEYATLLFRSLYEGLQPVLQSIMAKIKEYIPQLNEYLNIVGSFLADATSNFVKFLQTNVFVGSLSPENLRKLTKDTLSSLFTYIKALADLLYKQIETYLS